MSILTNGDSARASKRRKLSPSPEVDSDAVSSDEEQIESTATRRSRTVHRQRPSSNDTTVLPVSGATKSSMLALQVNELLSETCPDFERLESRLKPALDRLRNIILNIPERQAMLIGEAKKALKNAAGIEIPFCSSPPPTDSKYKFQYKKPEVIEEIGSLALHLSKTSSTALAVQMPEELLQEKDYLNHRAFHKRAFYLACIAAGIKASKTDEFDMHFEEQDDLDFVPVLVVKATDKSPAGLLQSKLDIRITVTFPHSAMPIEKTLPNKNCVRDVTINPDHLKPTPLYNSCLRSLVSVNSTQKFLRDLSRTCPAFAGTSRLASTWLHQRDIGSPMSKGGFGLEEWNVICAILLQTGGDRGQPLLSTRYTVFQLFKGLLQFLAGKDLTSPMVVRSALSDLPKTDFPVLFDGVTGANIFFKMTPWSYQNLKEEASLTLAAINARNENNFEPVFVVQTADSLLNFDELYSVKVFASTLPEKIFDVLSQGLGDRVKRINVEMPASCSWSISQAYKKPSNISLSIGLQLVPENKNRLVDHGPSAEDREEAAKFRAFWGERAELRRFKDGSIVESLVWSEETPVTSQIIRYLVDKHLGGPATTLISIANQADSLILDQYSRLKPVDAFKLLNSAYQELTTQLHQLEELPLRIRSIVPADAQLSSTSLILPLSSVCTPPADIYIEFENSTRWPDHLPAIQNTKIAFLVKLGEIIRAAYPARSTRVGLENTDTASSGHLNTSYLDIIYPSSAAGLPPPSLRLRISHDRELTLIEKALASKTLTPPAQSTMSHALQQQKRILAMQRHTTMIRNLATRFPALSGTIRLLRKWTSSHCLPPSLLPDPVLDLLCIYTFTHPTPWSPPSTAQTAFLRTLHTISRWDWASEPLLIDTGLESSLFASVDDISNLRTRFAAWRKLDPGMNNVALFVGTNLDPTGVVWTQGAQPPKVVAGRLTSLAKASMALVQEKGIDMKEGNWRGLFQSPLGAFDFLVHLSKGFGGTEEKKGKGKFKNLLVQESMDEESIGFDAVGMFVRDLERVFKENILFFYNHDGGRVIAGLWNPKVLEKKDFRVRMGVSSMPVAVDKHDGAEKEKVVVNQAGILAEIAMMGEGLVQNIEVLTDLVQ